MKIQYLGSKEYYQDAEKIGELLNISWEHEHMSSILNLIEDIFRYNLTSESQIKEAIKKWLDFLNEEQINSLYNYLKENFLPKVKELWQEEKIEEKEVEESFEEKEKRYLEIMKELIKSREIKLPPTKEEKPLIEAKPKPEIEEFKTISFEAENKIHLKEKIEEPELPESAIIIKRKKEEEKSKPEDEELIDFSKL